MYSRATGLGKNIGEKKKRNLFNIPTYHLFLGLFAPLARAIPWGFMPASALAAGIPVRKAPSSPPPNAQALLSVLLSCPAGGWTSLRAHFSRVFLGLI